jgi:hypothetical protein
VESRYLEGYYETLPIGSVYVDDIATPDKYDAQQYITWNGIKQVNMCGELCVCFLLGLSLSEFLTVWKTKAPSLFTRIFGSGRARGTGALELKEMLAVFAQDSRQLTDKTDRYTPHMLAEMKDASIVSVHIDSTTGRLNGGGVLHWVVPVRVWEERCGFGTVNIYNPYPNRLEKYSWAEFVASARSPYGVVML